MGFNSALGKNCLLGGFLLNPSSGYSKYSRSLAKTTLSTVRLSDNILSLTNLYWQSAMYTQTHLALWRHVWHCHSALKGAVCMAKTFSFLCFEWERGCHLQLPENSRPYLLGLYFVFCLFVCLFSCRTNRFFLIMQFERHF